MWTFLEILLPRDLDFHQRFHQRTLKVKLFLYKNWVMLDAVAEQAVSYFFISTLNNVNNNKELLGTTFHLSVGILCERWSREALYYYQSI